MMPIKLTAALAATNSAIDYILEDISNYFPGIVVITAQIPQSVS